MLTTATIQALRVGNLQGESHWWTGELATIKLTAEQTGGGLSVVEVLAPQGIRIPMHVHQNENEAFWILEGAATFQVGDTIVEARAGDCVFGPRGVPHRYSVDVGPARMIFLFTPGGFEGFIRESGETATVPELPPAHVVPDMARLAVAAAKYGCRILE